MPEKIIVIGVGNILFRDEGVGVYAALYLAANYRFTPEIEILDGATLGFRLMHYFQEYARIILIDTVSIEDSPGSLYRLPAHEMLGLGSYRQTAHEVEIVEMLEICSLLEKMAEVVILGVVPEDIKSIEVGLSAPLLGQFDALISLLCEELGRYGVSVERTGSTPLEQIIHQTTQREV